MRWWRVLAVLALVWWLASAGVPMIADIVDRGRKLTASTEDDDGVILEQPSELQAEAERTLGRAVSLDAYALARMVRSEPAIAAGQIERVYRAHVAVNQARALGWSVADVILFHTTPSRAGRFGAQTSGRFASRRDPYESDLAAAEFALEQAARGEDPTGGALNFVDGVATLEKVRSSWGSEGKVPGSLPNTQGGLFFFWRGQLPAQAEAA